MNITPEQLAWVWSEFGWSGLALVIFSRAMWLVGIWFKPWIEKILSAHINLVYTLTDSAKAHSEHHRATHVGLVCLGNAALELADESSRGRIRPHIDILKQTMPINPVAVAPDANR